VGSADRAGSGLTEAGCRSEALVERFVEGEVLFAEAADRVALEIGIEDR
jgi:hypothetical protein